MIKACIFDLDGVITDTAHHHYLSWKTIAETLDYHLTEEQNEQLKGVSRSESLNKIIGWANANVTSEQRTALLIQKNAYYLRSIEDLSPADILPGIADFLNDLDRMKIPMAIGSSSKNAIFILTKLNLLSRFKGISDGNSVVNTKPHPDVFLHAASLLQIEPKYCAVFEDAAAGVEAANAANMISIGMGTTTQLPTAMLCLKSLVGLTFDRLNKMLQ